MSKVAMLACVGCLALGVPLANAASPGGNYGKGTTGGGTPKGNRVCGNRYLKMSIRGDIFEIRGGKIALRKSNNAAVMRLANRLITDHTKSLFNAVALARRLHIAVPMAPSPIQQWALQVVQQFSGRQFNYRYSSLEVQDHLEDIDLARDEIKYGCNNDVKSDARTNLPVLQLHLRLAREALAASRP